MKTAIQFILPSPQGKGDHAKHGGWGVSPSHAARNICEHAVIRGRGTAPSTALRAVPLPLRGRLALATTCCLLATAAFAPTPLTPDWAAMNEPMEPFHIIGPIYDVGMKGLDVFFIRTEKGAVLIDGGFEQSVPQIEANIEKLGFSIKDVRYIINEHAHIDHAGGIAQLQRDSKAQVIANQLDVPALAAGQVDYGPSAGDHFPPVDVDWRVGDHDSMTIGGLTFFAHATPGHTKGCTSWTMRFWDHFREHTAIFTCSITVAGNPIAGDPHYPKITSDYRHSFATLRGVYADVVLAPHPQIWNRDEKLDRAAKGEANAFVDAGELRRLVDASEKDFDEQLAKQKAGEK